MSSSPSSPTEPAPDAAADTRAGDGTTVRLEQAEAAIVEHYDRLVRLGYLILPPGLGPHRRVLAAHGLAQRALPPRASARLATAPDPARAAAVPPQRGAEAAPPEDDAGYAYVRERLLRDALHAAAHPGGRLRRMPRRTGLLPRVRGLRLSPPPGGADELAMEQALFAATPAARAAFGLVRLEQLAPPAAAELLAVAGLTPDEAAEALRAADELPGGGRPALVDPGTLRARPTDLLRRRHYRRAAWAAGTVLVLGAGLLATLDGDDPAQTAGAADAITDDRPAGTAPAGNPALTAAADPRLLERAEPGDWQRASRVDFAVWEPRGPAVDDTELLARALGTWVAPGSSVEVTATPGTATGPPPAPPRLLYAGELEGSRVVVFHDGYRLVRYGEPVATGTGEGAAADEPAVAELEFARVDGAGPGQPAIVLHRGAERVRYLTAPWVEAAEVHELLSPGEDPDALALDESGVTAAAPTAIGREGCTTFPFLELTTPDGLPPGVLIDLGELLPAGVTDAAPGTGHSHPLHGEAARRLARTACHLTGLAESGVRTVNSWEFATQDLPEGAGHASWVCTRADTWRGTGAYTMTQLQLPPADGRGHGEPGTVTASTDEGAPCTLRDHHLVGAAVWRSPEDRWYLIAAGSPGVSGLAAEGDVTGETAGHTLVLPAERDTEAEVSGVITEHGTPVGTLR